MGKPQSYRCWTSKITKNDGVNQEELLVARHKERHQKICLRIYKMSAKQSIALEEGWRTSSIENTRETIARN